MMMFEQVTFLKPLKQILVTFKSEVRWVKGVEAHVCGCLIIPGFCSMKWSGVPLLITLKPGWEMCPSQVLLASSILLSFTGSFPVPYYSCILSGGENPPLPPPPPSPWGREDIYSVTHSVPDNKGFHWKTVRNINIWWPTRNLRIQCNDPDSAESGMSQSEV